MWLREKKRRTCNDLMFGQNVRENYTNATANLSGGDSLSEKNIRRKKIPSTVKKHCIRNNEFLDKTPKSYSLECCKISIIATKRGTIFAQQSVCEGEGNFHSYGSCRFPVFGNCSRSSSFATYLQFLSSFQILVLQVLLYGDALLCQNCKSFPRLDTLPSMCFM